MNATELLGILEFLRAAESLKTITRSGWTSAGRQESVAEHSWRLCLMATVLADAMGEVDVARLIRICIVHDLGEAISGDIPAPEQRRRGGDKSGDERADLLTLTEPLPPAIRDEILALWDEYEAGQTAEARLAKGLDKLETILQHTQGRNPERFDYRFNLTYGREYTDGHPLLVAFRELLDAETTRRAEAAEPR
jgi:putative hydrolases of HD superfamily